MTLPIKLQIGRIGRNIQLKTTYKNIQQLRKIKRPTASKKHHQNTFYIYS